MRLVALRLELAHQSGHALVDEGFDLGFGDICEFEPKHVASLREDGGEVTEEEDGVEDSCGQDKISLCAATNGRETWRVQDAVATAMLRSIELRSSWQHKAILG